MKCDSDPESCANCRASDTQCTHTHPITKTTWLRGEPERLRRENEMLKEENTRLQIEITRRDELLHQLTDNRNGQATMMNVVGCLIISCTAVYANWQQPLQGQKPGYGMAHVSGYSPFTYRPGHASPFQTTQSHYHQVPSSCMDSGSYQQNTGVTLPPILPQQQQQQQQQPHMSHSYNTATTGPSTTGFDIPAVTAPVTSAPATSSTLYAQHRDPQTDNDTGAGNGNGNGDGAGEYQQKGWPY